MKTFAWRKKRMTITKKWVRTQKKRLLFEIWRKIWSKQVIFIIMYYSSNRAHRDRDYFSIIFLRDSYFYAYFALILALRPSSIQPMTLPENLLTSSSLLRRSFLPCQMTSAEITRRIFFFGVSIGLYFKQIFEQKKNVLKIDKNKKKKEWQATGWWIKCLKINYKFESPSTIG